MSRHLGRFEGRLFAEGGCLFMVVGTDEAADTARVTCRIDDHTQVIEMPLTAVAERVSAGSGLILDNLNGPESAKRIVKGKDGWYFAAREGQIGPFESDKDAGQQLVRYILSMQTVNDKPRQPLRSATARRSETAGRHAAESRPTA